MSISSPTKWRATTLLAAGGLVAGGLLAAGSPAVARTSTSNVTMQRWTKIHTVNFGQMKATPAASARATAAAARIAHSVNRSLSRHPAANSRDVVDGFAPPVVRPTPVISSAPGLRRSWEGVNAFTMSAAQGFTFTPPDQGLCSGNGFVFEIVNNALQVFHGSGAPASPVVSTNPFFGLPPLLNTTTGKWGPELTDPTCTYDPSIGRWFVSEVALETDPSNGNLTLVNKATLAVSRTRNPLGSYNVYQMNLTDTHAGGMHVDCPCIGDFPKIAVDSHGLFLSTNEYPWSGAGFYGNGFNGAQLYAASKLRLAAGVNSVPAVHFSNTSITAGGHTVPGFTVWPAAVPGTSFARANGGTEYFVSSTAGAEANPTSFTGFSRTIGVYRMTNTQSLDTSHPSLTLTRALLPSELYGEAPLAGQKPGPVPLRDCLAVTCHPGVGPSSEQEGSLDPSDTRPLTVWYAGGRLTMALSSVMRVNGNLQAGPAWFVINPSSSPSSATIQSQGYIGLANNNVIFPSVATAPSGTGVMAFTLAGHNYYPTQGYIPWSASGPTTGITETVPGAAPLDDFCQYNFFNCAVAPVPLARPRFGDYSWANYMNGNIIIANEVVSASCTFARYNMDPTCGGTRAPLSNWSTRISVIKP